MRNYPGVRGAFLVDVEGNVERHEESGQPKVHPTAPVLACKECHGSLTRVKPAMPTFLLCVKPELEGLVSFEPGEGCDWKLDFKQSAGSEERKGVVVDPQNEEEVPNAKGDT